MVHHGELGSCPCDTQCFVPPWFFFRRKSQIRTRKKVELDSFAGWLLLLVDRVIYPPPKQQQRSLSFLDDETRSLPRGIYCTGLNVCPIQNDNEQRLHPFHHSLSSIAIVVRRTVISKPKLLHSKIMKKTRCKYQRAKNNGISRTPHYPFSKPTRTTSHSKKKHACHHNLLTNKKDHSLQHQDCHQQGPIIHTISLQ